MAYTDRWSALIYPPGYLSKDTLDTEARIARRSHAFGFRETAQVWRIAHRDDRAAGLNVVSGVEPATSGTRPDDQVDIEPHPVTPAVCP